MPNTYSKEACLKAMFYNLLGVPRTADDERIIDEWKAKFKKADSDQRSILNNAKTCLTDADERAAYDKALILY